MFCSTIIPTIGRSTLSRAVDSVLEQTFTRDDFEIIVVNDSGQPLPPADWQQSARVQVIHTNRRERSVARNSGAAMARGKYLHFLDDDDWMLPGAFQALWELTQTCQAAWLYGGYRLVDDEGNLLEECHPDESGNCFVRFMVGEWLPLQASFIDAKSFFAVGGFASLASLLGGDEDVDLSRQITLRADIAGTFKLVAAIRIGQESSTTNYTSLQEQSRQSREKALSMPGAFARLRASAIARKTNLGYWQGKIIRAYLTSVIWNIQRKRLFTGASRGLYGMAGITLAGRELMSAGFWRSVAKSHIAKGWMSSKI